MTSTLIYRSRALEAFPPAELERLAARAFASNLRLDVTGILVFDGDYFLQVLEGPADAVTAVFDKLSRDPRHDNLVTLLHGQEARRRFGSWGMYLTQPDRSPQTGIRPWMPQYHHLHEEDRVAQIVDHFLHGQWKHRAIAQPIAPDEWALQAIPFPLATRGQPLPDSGYSFAFQPIVNSEKRAVSSIEALVRGPGGMSPQDLFSRFGSDTAALYDFDLQSKVMAIAQAVALGCRTDLSINLLPRSLTHARDSAAFLLDALAQHGLSPEQLVIEVTEEEAITNFDEFRAATQRMRAAGVRLAIDDFGAGHAGLSLLTEFHPDILKIDRRLVRGISSNGPRQAIVAAIIDLCRPLGIAVVAEGIETIEEFDWLNKAGVHRFQGFLFARPAHDRFDVVHIPVKAGRRSDRLRSAP